MWHDFLALQLILLHSIQIRQLLVFFSEFVSFLAGLGQKSSVMFKLLCPDKRTDVPFVSFQETGNQRWSVGSGQVRPPQHCGAAAATAFYFPGKTEDLPVLPHTAPLSDDPQTSSNRLVKAYCPEIYTELQTRFINIQHGLRRMMAKPLWPNFLQPKFISQLQSFCWVIRT